MLLLADVGVLLFVCLDFWGGDRHPLPPPNPATGERIKRAIATIPYNGTIIVPVPKEDDVMLYIMRMLDRDRD